MPRTRKPPTITALQTTLAQLEYNRQYARLSPKRKKVIQRLAAVHLNPDSQAPDVVVKSMRKQRRAMVMNASEQIARVLGSVGTRGREGLEAIGDSEWERMINET